MKKKQSYTFIYFLIVVALFFPTLTIKAQGLPFGGIVSSPITCTCSPVVWIWFTPLYLGGPTVVSGPIVYSPFSTILYANFNIGVPSKYHLGSYIPGAQACWMYAVAGCFPLPSLGIMTKVGTN